MPADEEPLPTECQSESEKDAHSLGLTLPNMRAEVITALERLSDRDYQQRVWIERVYPEPTYYDELDFEIHILFDDIDVCVDPDRWVGVVLYPRDVEPLRTLGVHFQSLIDDLGDVSDQDYLADPRWLEVVRLSAVALEVLRPRP